MARFQPVEAKLFELENFKFIKKLNFSIYTGYTMKLLNCLKKTMSQKFGSIPKDRSEVIAVENCEFEKSSIYGEIFFNY